MTQSCAHITPRRWPQYKLTQFLERVSPARVQPVKVALNRLDDPVVSMQCCHLSTQLGNLFLVRLHRLQLHLRQVNRRSQKKEPMTVQWRCQTWETRINMKNLCVRLQNVPKHSEQYWAVQYNNTCYTAPTIRSVLGYPILYNNNNNDNKCSLYKPYK